MLPCAKKFLDRCLRFMCMMKINLKKQLNLVDTTSPYALTGAVIAQDRDAIELGNKKITNMLPVIFISMINQPVL